MKFVSSNQKIKNYNTKNSNCNVRFDEYLNLDLSFIIDRKTVASIDERGARIGVKMCVD